MTGDTTLIMRRLIGTIKTDRRSKKVSQDSQVTSNASYAEPTGDGPDAVVVREITAFCDSGAPNSASAGDEYLHLPAIVDAAEASASAAKNAALTIQRYLGKQNYSRGYAQYNAVMLMRILTDNPGRRFTQNFDKAFVSTVKDLLKDCKDGNVQQITRETLDHFEADKLRENDTLTRLIEMWRKQKGPGNAMQPITSRYSVSRAPPQPVRQVQPRGLPPIDELVARVEEAKTSARLLIQMVQSTPQHELPGNDLVREFAERARQAHRSIQTYMAAENPSPDDATMMTLIETSEQLNIAMTKHQRALLQARKILGQVTPSPQPQSQQQNPFNAASPNSALSASNNYLTPLVPRQGHQQKAPVATTTAATQFEQTYIPPPGPPPSRAPNTQTQLSPTSYQVPQNPFADDNDMYAGSNQASRPAMTDTANTIELPGSTPSASPYARFHSAAAANTGNTSAAPTEYSTISNGTTNNYYGGVANPYLQRGPIHDRTTTAELDSNPYPTPMPGHRPDYTGTYGGGPTQSFMHRQESSLDKLNMSGAS